MEKKVDFTAYLIRTMKGVANDSRTSATRRDTVELEAMAIDGTNVEEVLGRLGHADPDHLTQIISEEAAETLRAQAQADLDLIDTFFKDDIQVQILIVGRKEGSSSSDIREIGEMTKLQYESASKRLQRGLTKLFQGK